MSAVTNKRVSTTFRSLRIRNYRLYFTGQAVSLMGTWMQRVAQSWLVLELTSSGTAVGAVTAFQFLPLLLLAPFGGVLADRFDKRRILYVTQTMAAISALGLGFMVVTGAVELWMVYVSAALLGISAAFDAPARQTFVEEMVGRSQLSNAVSLNTTLVNAARIVGPALGGFLIVGVGIGWCFILNGFSYISLIVALLAMRSDELHPGTISGRSRGQIVEGFKYVARTPEVRTPLILITVAGFFVYEYSVILPLLARFTFGGDAQTFAAMSSAMGVGAVFGGLIAASRVEHVPVWLARTGLVFGVMQVVVSFGPTLWSVYILLAVVGACSVTFIAMANTTLQLTAEPAVRGRVMGMYVLAFFGTTPFGATLMGWVGEHVGPRFALGLGGVTLILAALYALPRLGREPLVGGPRELTPPAKI
ncbi:MAG TPA: MFS transporter [Acidimicrobiia bacterium]|nr:MFS transporter [Acidimicrobiia bacterium]